MFRVTQKFNLHGPETLVQNFNDERTAREEIQKKLMEDSSMNMKKFYCLYDGYDLLEQFDQSKLKESADTKDSDSANSGSDKGNTNSFRPSPFQTSPRPTGMPPSSWRSDDEDEKNK